MVDIMWIALELAANIFETFLAVYFVMSSFNNKCKIFNVKTTYLIGILSMTIIVSLLNNFTVYEGILGLIYAMCYFVFALIFLNGSIFKKLFISVLTDMCFISVALVVGNAITLWMKNDPMKIYTEHCLERFLYIVISMAVLVYIFKMLLSFTSRGKELLKFKEWGLILSVLVVSFLIIAVIHIIMLDGETDDHNKLLMASELGVVIINILCLYITTNLNETHKREEKLLIEKRRDEYSQKYAQTIKEQYDQTRRLRHDMKQYAASISTLIKSKKYDLAIEFIDKQTENLSKVETVINVENDFINAILNTKLTYAKSQSIDVLCSIEKDVSGIEDMDLCNLLGNLLDNAIRAAEQCNIEFRLIEVKISSVGSRLIMQVKNSIPNSVLSDNPELKSTKQNISEHGFGIKTIKYIAEKYNGKADFYEEDLTFISRVELYKVTKTK